MGPIFLVIQYFIPSTIPSIIFCLYFIPSTIFSLYLYFIPSIIFSLYFIPSTISSLYFIPSINYYFLHRRIFFLKGTILTMHLNDTHKKNYQTCDHEEEGCLKQSKSNDWLDASPVP